MARKRKSNKKIWKVSLLAGIPTLITAILTMLWTQFNGISLYSGIIITIFAFGIGALLGRVINKINYKTAFILPSLITLIYNLIATVQSGQWGLKGILMVLILSPIIQGLLGMLVWLIIRRK